MRVCPKMALALGLCLAAVPAQAQDEAYPVLGFKMMSSPANPFPYYLDVDSRRPMPTTVLVGQVQLHVDTAYQSWQGVGCAYPAFVSKGPTNNHPQITDPRDPYDGFNVTAIWIVDPNDPAYGLALGGGTAAAATIPVHYAGTLYQCDIFINAVDFSWSTLTPTPAGQLDLQTLVLHEIGHCLGLGHSDDWADVMWPSVELGGQRRALTARDSAKLCELYPMSGAVGSPCQGDGGCGEPELHCVLPPLPDGGVGAPLCSKGCVPTVPGGCDSPFVCKPATLIDGHPGACLPSQGDHVTQVGAPCQLGTQCGSAVGLCLSQGDLPSGAPEWQGGYCTQSCGVANVPCPQGSACIGFRGEPLCLKICRLGAGDCRQGHTCIRATEELNLCVSSCGTDVDCDPSQLCRTCDGSCLPKQSPTAQVGDLCSVSSGCGPEQFCLRFLGGPQQGLCSKNCGTSCAFCSQGSTCHPLADQNHYCLKDCISGSCPQGYQCGLLPSGRACIPGCSGDQDCPVGTTCAFGQCSGPQDGGDCPLCPSDGGTYVPPQPRPDAGPGPGGGSGGCGCGAAGAQAASLPFVLAALLALGRRRRSF